MSVRYDLPFIRKVILILGDVLCIALSVYCSVYIVLKVCSGEFSTLIYYQMLPLHIIIMLIMFNIYGLFTLSKKRYGEIFIGIVLSTFYSLIIMMALSFYLRAFSYSRGVLLITAVLEILLLNVWQNICWRVINSLEKVKGTLLIGNKSECEHIKRRLESSRQFKYVIKNILSDDVQVDWATKIAMVDLVILGSNIDLTKKAMLVDICQGMQKDILIMPSIYELYCSRIGMDKIDDIPLFRPKYMKMGMEKKFLKRLFDVVFATFSLLGLSLPMFFIAILIKLDSAGPIFYKQERVGLYGKTFYVYKFRTMQKDAEKATGPVMASDNDVRITRVGNILRRMRLDELPQFFNVLFGSMSVVGPRPERPFFVKQFQREIPEYNYRHNVKPGITGMAQIYGKYNTTAYDKLIYDLMYVQESSIYVDLILIIQTVRVLFIKNSTEGVDGE